MNKKLLLIRGITLLYRAAQLPLRAIATNDLVREVAETVELPDMVVGSSDSERELIQGLKTMAVAMANDSDKTVYVESDVLQRIRHFTVHDESLYDTLKEGISGNLEEQDLRLLTGNIRRELKDYLDSTKAFEFIKESYRKGAYNRDEITDYKEFVANLRQVLEPFEAGSKEVDPAIVGMVSLSNIDQVKDIFTQSKELNDERGIMRLGWQGLNRMLQGGVRRGECGVMAALQHNFKTGITLSMFKHIALYNKPFMIDPKKKPMLLRITLEDPLTLNLPFLYRNIKENKTLEPVDILTTPPEEMALYVQQELSVNGYEIHMIHVNPSQWGYRDLQNYILELEAQGYEIHLCMVDYLNMLDKKGCDNNGPMGSNIRDLFRRMRNFCAPRKITLITPHQLSTEAKMLIRQGNELDFVKEIANKGYYDSCKTIDQEVDWELYFHIIKADSRSWMAIQRGKHRLVKQTKEEHKFTILPFEDVGDIRDDVNGPDTSRKKPGGPAAGDKNQSAAFWDFEG